MINYHIRKAIPSDIHDIILLCAAHAAYEKAEYSMEGKAEKLAAAIFADNPVCNCLIVVTDEGISGYATYTFEYSTWDAAYYTMMDCLYLKDAIRGHGIGEALMKAIAIHSIKKENVMMQWHTPSFNTRAIKFYKRIGGLSKDKVRFYLHQNQLINLSNKI